MRSIMTSNKSRVVGSIQCASSRTIRTGRRLAKVNQAGNDVLQDQFLSTLWTERQRRITPSDWNGEQLRK